jgi:hypothetical protein
LNKFLAHTERHELVQLGIPTDNERSGGIPPALKEEDKKRHSADEEFD